MKIFIKHDKFYQNDYYRNNLKPDDYKRIAESVGFKNIKIINVCPFPIFVPITIKTDKKITKIYKFILKIKLLFQKYPYKTNKLFSQGHFLVAYK